MRKIRIIAPVLAILMICSLFSCSELPRETSSVTSETSESDFLNESAESVTEKVTEDTDSEAYSEKRTETEKETEKSVEITSNETSETEIIFESVSETEKNLESVSETDVDNQTVDLTSETLTEKEEFSIESEESCVGLDITNMSDLVSICYSVWFDGILGEGDEPVTDFYNISEVLAGRQEWGKEGQFHYWGKPAQGYYRSTDKKAIKNNMTLLAAAGIDFIILDYTNANDGYVTNAAHGERWAFAPLRALCETVTEMRAEGKKTPYIVLWCGESNGELIDAFYERFYTVEEWKDCFVYWDGKPFMITTKPTERFPRRELFTVRYMWGLTSDDCWKFLNVSNGRSTVFFNGGEPEQISVAVATQETYMSHSTAHGRKGGRFFYDQWKNAFKFHPKVVTVTWWNEWAAQRFIVDGETTFVDNYTQEYSRDIEPMEGGHGDLYYRWLCEYVRAYKSGEDCPKLYVTEE